ncbi:MAG: epoxyqueuosine reductase QueH [Bacilli bacterium]|nr:epoxyqueuosine reductase QueH [Bacilli bacterium]
MNYDKLMQEEISEIGDKVPKLLLHACCAPCSSSCIERLADVFEITIFYYNPNITNEEEYNKRLNEVKSFVKKYKTKYPIEVIGARYDPNEFFEIAKGLENEPERGARCYKCYNLRLKETAFFASNNGFDFFATTLTLSPYKKADWINKIGEQLDKEYKSKYLYSDFKKRNGYKRSIELSYQYNLYRQDYCGCIYSLRK